MLLILFFILSILFIIALFSSSRLSPIPYFPTNKKDLPFIIKALKLKNNQIVVDLGAGDGVVVFTAAEKAFEKKLNTKFIAVEINVVLIIILYLRRLFHPNKKNIKIIWGDMFKINLKAQISKLKTKSPSFVKTSHFVLRTSRDESEGKQNLNLPAIEQCSNVTIYLYISPWLIEKTVSWVIQQLPKASFVSYMYPIPSLKKSQSWHGEHHIFRYN